MFRKYTKRIAAYLAAAILVSSTPVYADEDSFDKSNTIMGIVYNELRAMEIEWASKLRAYGTSKVEETLALTDGDGNSTLTYTEEYVSVEEYANSAQGDLDQIGDWVSGQAYDDDNDEYITISGILGPEPFATASESEYKIIEEIDGGNSLEIRGKPQEGYTSNAKEIAAMTEVFFSQTLDAMQAELDESSGWKKICLAFNMLLKALGTYCSVNNIPILGALAEAMNLSYTTIARNYAYPLMQYSHTANFFLSEYIYPTRWTVPNETLYEAGGGSASDMESASRSSDHYWDDDQALTDDDLQYSESSSANIGISTEGGSGKTDSDYQNSWTNSSSWVEIEYCPDDEHDGFGCMQSEVFVYLWEGTFATGKFEGDLASVSYDSDALQTLWYGTGSALVDVSAEVSPFDDYDMYSEYGWNYEEACIVHPTAMSEAGALCWDYEGSEEVDAEDVKDKFGLSYQGASSSDTATTTEVKWTFTEPDWYDDDVKEFFTQSLTDAGWMVAGFEETDDGFYVYLVGSLCQSSVEVQTKEAGYAKVWADIDTDGDGVVDSQGYIEEWQDAEYETRYYANFDNTDAIRLYFTHDCLGADGDTSTDGHTGTYCGGHLQLKIRGVVYGFSEDQLVEEVIEEDETGVEPKFLDPTGWDETSYVEGDESTYPSIDDVDESEIEAFGDLGLTVWTIDQGIMNEDDYNYVTDDGGTAQPYISYADMLSEGETGEDGVTVGTGAYAAAEDLFDIDILIKRDISTYPGYNGVLTYGTQSDGTVETGTSYFWRSWTQANMTQVTSLVLEDWKDMYNLSDTQTIVGGAYDTTSSAYNDASQTVLDNILELLGYYNLPVETADISDPTETGYYDLDGDGEYDVLTAYERERIDRLRHVVYALNCIGEVSYSQSAHSYFYGDVAGNLSDCSGFVSNIWRDRIEGSVYYSSSDSYNTTTLTTSGLWDLAEAAGALYEYTGVGTEGIDTGDIILKDVGGSGAHALIYIGEFDVNDIYTDGSFLTGDSDSGNEEVDIDTTYYEYVGDDITLTAIDAEIFGFGVKITTGTVFKRDEDNTTESSTEVTYKFVDADGNSLEYTLSINPNATAIFEKWLSSGLLVQISAEEYGEESEYVEGDSDGGGADAVNETGSTIQVFTVDCSSMVMSWDTLENESDYPDAAAFTSGDYESAAVELTESNPIVRSGNVRFCNRTYMQTDQGHDYSSKIGIWYIDMTKLSDYLYSDDEGNTVEEGDAVIVESDGSTVCEISSDPDSGLSYGDGYVEAGYVSEFLFDFEFLGDSASSYWTRVSSSLASTASTAYTTYIATSVTYWSYETFMEYIASLSTTDRTSFNVSASSGTGSYASYTDEQILGAITYGEAGNQGYVGQVAVLLVILNRVRYTAWPNTIYGVVFQKNQFEATDGFSSDVKIYSSVASLVRALEDAVDVMNAFLAGESLSRSYGGATVESTGDSLLITYGGVTYDFTAATYFNSLSGGGSGWVWINDQRFYPVYVVT